MDRVIYTAMTGATALVNRQQAIANNLANVSTNGFRAELSTYRSVPVQGSGASTRVMALEATAGHLETPGTLNSTGRNLDVAAVGNAYFAVQGLDGLEAYTRSGNLQVSVDGTLTSATGLPMLDEGGAPIAIPENAQVAIASDGTVSARVGNDPPQLLGRMKLVTPNDEVRVKRGDDGLYRAADRTPLPQDTNARLKDGMLEGSNVNAIEAMVGMIAVARQFEQQMRLLQTAEKNDQTAAQLLGLNG
ncbi:MAG TPA: flagellar basal-body rod protein FlgF [Burkholderiaceae bacterium]|jgi:flagellar basal-body rod protein FlgF|nr:flagellar basal-body rod protein FlgF [Burkholderiaceae bacterium]